MPPRLPELEVKNFIGSCWTCVESGAAELCDAALPYCSQCQAAKRSCSGYQVRFRWRSGIANHENPPRENEPKTSVYVTWTCRLSSSGLPAAESRLIQHYFGTVSRIALAIDCVENGFRKLCTPALEDPALLHALLAFSEAHLCRFQRRKDMKSGLYITKSLEYLRRRLDDPSTAKSEITLATMVILFTYEACAANGKWKYHFDAISSWIRSRDTCGDLDPFLITVVCTLATHVTLHTRGVYRSRAFELLGSITLSDQNREAVDVHHGCSVGLPKLMATAAQINEDYLRATEKDDSERLQELRHETHLLQQQIQATSIPADSTPRFALSASRKLDETLTVANLPDERQVRRSAGATAECYRYALHIYVFRIVDDSFITPVMQPQMQQAIDQFFRLLPLVPVTEGPGVFLGWALVVIGAEVDSLEQREYVLARLTGLELICLNQGILAKKVLSEVWQRRDAIRAGSAVDRRWRWQEVMQILREDLALI